MTEFKLTPDLTLVSTRCYECNRFYGYERNHDARCPHCAAATCSRLNAEIRKLERANAALRGHLGKRQP